MSVLRSRLVVVLLVVVLLASAASVVLALTRPAPTEGAEPVAGRGYVVALLADPAGPALEAAVAGAPLVLTHDHRDLDGSLRRAQAMMTPQFARAFARAFDRDTRGPARRERTVTDARVRGAGVVRTRGEDAVVCLLYLDQRRLAGRDVPAEAAPRTVLRVRVLVAMARRDGRWLVDGVRRV